MNIIQLYQDFSIPFQTEGHKHCRPGWVNAECPFCFGNPGLHLGYNLEENHFYCWRCGAHFPDETISKLLKVTRREANQLIKDYDGFVSIKSPDIVIRTKSFKLPSGIELLKPSHKTYLKRRGFDPYQLNENWGILSTGPVSFLDDINYSHRIIIPINWEGKMVTFQARDVTGKSKRKYLACPADRELVNIKTIIYGNPVYWGDIGICVEGVTDVWRLGPYSFCVFGIKYTMTQVRVIAKHFRRVAVMFDDDPQAQVEAGKLVAELQFRGLNAWVVPIVGDPGGMSQEEANTLVSNILKNK